MADSDIVRALKGLLSQDLLGLEIHDEVNETSHHSQFRWSDVSDQFRLMAIDSPFYDSLCAAFTKVHDHKYIDHPNFKLAMDNELRSMGIPTSARESGLKCVDDLISKLSEELPSERDAGWNPDMEGRRDVTSYADDRGAKTSDPHTGGGPAPSKTLPESNQRKKKRRPTTLHEALEDLEGNDPDPGAPVGSNQRQIFAFLWRKYTEKPVNLFSEMSLTPEEQQKSKRLIGFDPEVHGKTRPMNPLSPRTAPSGKTWAQQLGPSQKRTPTKDAPGGGGQDIESEHQPLSPGGEGPLSVRPGQMKRRGED